MRATNSLDMVCCGASGGFGAARRAAPPPPRLHADRNAFSRLSSSLKTLRAMVPCLSNVGALLSPFCETRSTIPHVIHLYCSPSVGDTTCWRSFFSPELSPRCPRRTGRHWGNVEHAMPPCRGVGRCSLICHAAVALLDKGFASDSSCLVLGPFFVLLRSRSKTKIVSFFTHGIRVLPAY